MKSMVFPLALRLVKKLVKLLLDTKLSPSLSFDHLSIVDRKLIPLDFYAFRISGNRRLARCKSSAQKNFYLTKVRSKLWRAIGLLSSVLVFCIMQSMCTLDSIPMSGIDDAYTLAEFFTLICEVKSHDSV